MKSNKKYSKRIFALFLGMIMLVSIISAPNMNRVFAAKQILADTFHDKVRGAWIGELIGNYSGLPTEGGYVNDPNPASSVPWVCNSTWNTDDDTSMEWVFLHMMTQYGYDSVTYNQMVPEWQAHFQTAIWCANAAAKSLMDQGYVPPTTGQTGYNGSWDAIDAQIECEVFGQIAPGMLDNALTREDYWARVTNDQHAVDTAKFYSVICADAFFTSDATTLINDAKAKFSTGSLVYQMATDVQNWKNQYPSWRDCRLAIKNKYNESWVNAKLNFCSVLMALLYGGGDWKNSVQVALLAGWDNDCNAATTGCIMGIIKGYSGMPSDLTSISGDTYYDTNRAGMPASESINNKIVADIQTIAEANIIKRGGTVTGSGSGKTYNIVDGAFTPPGAGPTNTPVPTPAPTLVGYWKFDETSGTTASDSSGRGHAGTVSGATWIAGKINNGLNFNGSNNYVSVPDSSDFKYASTNSFSLVAWVYVPSLPGAWKGIVTKSRDLSPWNGIWIDNTNKWVFGGPTNVIGGSVTTGWHHLACVQNGPGNQRILYLDGTQNATGTSQMANGTGQLWIGGANSMSEYFNGKIDEVRIYNYALSSTEVQNLYNGGGATPTPTPTPTPGATATPTPTPSSGGVLTGSGTTPGNVNLSTEGTTDWAHWGLVDASSFNHKSGVTQQISSCTLIGNDSIHWYNNNPNTYTWTGGTPTASATNTVTGIYTCKLNNGLQISVPAGTTQKTLKVYVGVWYAKGKFEATLSDGSAAAYTDYIDNSTGTTNRVYTITFKAASNGQTLTIKHTVNTAYDVNNGNVTLQAATLY
jgi:hypothetical protein